MSYGCFNRAPLIDYLEVQSGYIWGPGYSTRTPRVVHIADKMRKDCVYQADDKYNDPGCVGCYHKKPISPQLP